MKKALIILPFILFIVIIIYAFQVLEPQEKAQVDVSPTATLPLITNTATPTETPSTKISIGVFGDSYTAGYAVNSTQTYHAELVKLLNMNNYEASVDINISKFGWTSSDLLNAIKNETVKKLDYAILLIGTNDYAFATGEQQFRLNYVAIIESIRKYVDSDNKIILLYIPDFSGLEGGKKWANGRDLKKGIAEINNYIESIAQENGYNTVDIFTLSADMVNDKSLVHTDKFHPTAKEYSLWAEEIAKLF